MAALKSETELNADQITEKALALIDEEGLSGFSLRKLARVMEIYPNALLWHVESRDALLARVVALVLKDVPPDTGGQIWQDSLAEIAYCYRRAVQQHPNIAPLLGADLTSNAGVNLDLVEAILAALHQTGKRGEKLVQAYNSFTGAVVGFVTLEFSPPPSDGGLNLETELKEVLEDPDRGTYPILAGLAPQMTNKAFITRWSGGATHPMDDAFDNLLETLIQGLAR